MKRTGVLLITVAVGSFALGQAVPKLKFPYVSKQLNNPCAKTVFEWRCVENSFQPRCIKLCPEFDATAIRAMPMPKGLLVRAAIELRPKIKLKPGDKAWNNRMGACRRSLYYYTLKHFGEGRGKDKAFEDWRDLRVEVFHKGKLVAWREFREMWPT